MPLVVPGVTDQKDGDKMDKTMEWQHKLLGKKIGEKSDATTFARTELPKEHRIIKDGDMMTMDHSADRINVHVANDGTISKVTRG